MAASAELRIAVGERGGDVSGLLLRPDGARLLYVLAHGAGAGMRHPFLETVARLLGERGIGTLRYQFPHMERRAKPLPGVRGLVFLGFPLHPPGRAGDQRAEHLAQVQVPMLFLQGTRDDFADLTLLKPLIKRLGQRATLHLVEGGDHSFHVLKRSGRTDADVMGEIADAIAEWSATTVK